MEANVLEHSGLNLVFHEKFPFAIIPLIIAGVTTDSLWSWHFFQTEPDTN